MRHHWRTVLMVAYAALVVSLLTALCLLTVFR